MNQGTGFAAIGVFFAHEQVVTAGAIVHQGEGQRRGLHQGGSVFVGKRTPVTFIALAHRERQCPRRFGIGNGGRRGGEGQGSPLGAVPVGPGSPGGVCEQVLPGARQQPELVFPGGGSGAFVKGNGEISLEYRELHFEPVLAGQGIVQVAVSGGFGLAGCIQLQAAVGLADPPVPVGHGGQAAVQGPVVEFVGEPDPVGVVEVDPGVGIGIAVGPLDSVRGCVGGGFVVGPVGLGEGDGGPLVVVEHDLPDIPGGEGTPVEAHLVQGPVEVLLVQGDVGAAYAEGIGFRDGDFPGDYPADGNLPVDIAQDIGAVVGDRHVGPGIKRGGAELRLPPVPADGAELVDQVKGGLGGLVVQGDVHGGGVPVVARIVDAHRVAVRVVGRAAFHPEGHGQGVGGLQDGVVLNLDVIVIPGAVHGVTVPAGVPQGAVFQRAFILVGGFVFSGGTGVIVEGVVGYQPHVLVLHLPGRQYLVEDLDVVDGALKGGNVTVFRPGPDIQRGVEIEVVGGGGLTFKNPVDIQGKRLLRGPGDGHEVPSVDLGFGSGSDSYTIAHGEDQHVLAVVHLLFGTVEAELVV